MKPLTTTTHEGVTLTFSYRKSKHKGALSNDHDCFVEFQLNGSGYRNMAVIPKPVDTNEDDAVAALAQAAIERLTPWAAEIIKDNKK